jgi:hypothetical protein
MNNSDNTIHTDIPAEFRERLPRDIDFNDIGRINLSEAEKIAGEEILFLTEADLIEGLEDFDLIPLKGDDSFIQNPKHTAVRHEPAYSEDESIISSETRAETQPVVETVPVPVPEPEPEPVEPAVSFNEVTIDDELLITDDTLQSASSSGAPETVILDESELIVEDFKPEDEPLSSQRSDIQPVADVYPPEAAAEAEIISDDVSAGSEEIITEDEFIAAEPAAAEDISMGTAELEISDEPFFPAEKLEDSPRQSPAEKAVPEPVKASNGSVSPGTKHISDFVFIDDEFESGDAAFRSVPEPAAAGLSENEAPVTADAESVGDMHDSKELSSSNPPDEEIALTAASSVGRVEAAEIVKPRAASEVLPEELSALEMVESGVRFIDDVLLDKPKITYKESGAEGALDRLTAGMVQIFTGKPVELIEIADKNNSSFFHLDGRSALRTLENMVRDADEEYIFTDDEVDFIHSAVISEDYANYISNIDLFYKSIGKKSVTAAVELLGLTKDEFGSYEDTLFAEEYEDVDLYQIFDFFITDKKLKDISSSINRSYKYIQRNSGTLDDYEKNSIEEDLSTDNALIFEEDIEEIKLKLGTPVDAGVSPVSRPVEKASELTGPEPIEKMEFADDLKDITDKVIILDDEDDIDRFVGEMPDYKRGDIKRLLKYLDGLFEKLPETAVKNFASSEYFNLYVKVLNDLGV